MKTTIKAPLLIFFALASILLSGQTPIRKFTISGKVQGFESGTIIYLNDVSEGYYKKIDSTIISNNKFQFAGSLKKKYLKVSLTSFDYEDRVTFWVERGVTSFVGEKGNFSKAAINGSFIQKKWNEFNNILDTAKNTAQTEYLFIEQNPNSVISAHNLSHNLRTWGKDSIAYLYSLFTKEVKQSEYAKKVHGFLSLNRNIKIGDNFADFSQRDTSSSLVKLSDFKGKVVLLDFWASWCGPCREGNAELVKIYNELKPRGFEILGVASETNKIQWSKAIKTDGLTWTNVSDLKGGDNKAALIYGVIGYPTNFLIDKAGKIVAKDVYGEELKHLLLSMLR